MYVVYVGHKISSHAEQDLIWARLIPGRAISKPQGRWNLKLYVGTKKVIMLTKGFFDKSVFTLAVWLQNLLDLLHAEHLVFLQAWEETSKFMRAVVRIVLEEAAGDDLTMGDKWGADTLRQTNEDDREKLPLFIRPFFGGGAGLAPHYYHQTYATPWFQAVNAKKRTEQMQPRTQQGESSNDFQESSDEGDIFHEEDDNQDSIALGLSNSPLPRPGSVKQDDVVHLRHKRRATIPRSPTLRETSEPSKSPIKEWHDEIDRLIVRPIKEKAVCQIEELLKGWLDGSLDGSLDEDTLEANIRTSLSDVRLTRQMQNALIQSKSANPAHGEGTRAVATASIEF